MTVTAWSYGAACVIFIGLALQLGLTRGGGRHRSALAAACVLSAVWGLAGWAFAVTQVFGFLIAAAVADALRMCAWFAFLVLLLAGARDAETASRCRPLIRVGAVLGCFALFSVIAAANAWPILGAPGRLAMLSSLGMAVFALVLLETLYRNVSADARWQVKPLCIGLAAVCGFDVYVYSDALLFNLVDVHAFSVRGFVNAAIAPLIAIGAARTGAWHTQVRLSHRVVFHSAALVATGVYLLFVAGAGYYVRIAGGTWGPAFQVALLFAGLVGLCVFATSGAVRARLRVFVAKHFHSHRYDYREEWLRFTRTLASAEGEAVLGQQIVHGLANLVESPGGALWLREGADGEYRQRTRWNMGESAGAEGTDGGLVRYLRESGWVVDLDEYRSSPGRYGELRIPEWLSALPSAWLIVPLALGDDLIGFVVLGTPRTRIAIDWEVGDLLKTAARQAASFIGHMQATEALLESRKFDAFNRMSAFVVHDLKNLVAQLSLMLKNAERHKYNVEFQEDMLATVQHVVQRMQHLMLQLRDGNTPIQSAAPVNVADVVRRVARTKQGQEPQPVYDLQEDVLARGHAERIERVIGHLVQNAIDATPRSGGVRVRAERARGHAVVEVCDDGCGMTPEFARERLFKPFQTTKDGGMGIGAYESLQYVRELGGDIDVETRVGGGTTMRVLLPLYDDARSAREQPEAVA
ncbi:MAG TPA: XrtA/PEP-CTERM system histidine kinase PrsK [Burkholderiales bacterium]|nr:XrtA/PEP-CTERM system histidine kinase PrsK [Burkholderiales bacterium]